MVRANKPSKRARARPTQKLRRSCTTEDYTMVNTTQEEEEEVNVNLNYDSEDETYQNNWNDEISESLPQIVDKSLLNDAAGNAGEGSLRNACSVVGNASGNSYQSFSDQEEIEY
ncbi:11774_t:CDS:2 [Ambispora leptoticha]|uniref:11774_t:CDS:1 n=1 Tax=Ambispora leptoticha TaxID=144679 RepID=A0A9N9EY46_9GLOM|nr:11774_t:CDS:2 [Ambispora leptoticha]